MIKFEAKIKVLSVEHKTLKTTSGNDFSFTEVKVVDLDEKHPTTLVARLGQYVEEDVIQRGLECDAIFLIASNAGRDGRIWNNFILSGIKQPPKDLPEEVKNVSKPKTNNDVLDDAQAFMDDIPF